MNPELKKLMQSKDVTDKAKLAEALDEIKRLNEIIYRQNLAQTLLITAKHLDERKLSLATSLAKAVS